MIKNKRRTRVDQTAKKASPSTETIRKSETKQASPPGVANASNGRSAFVCDEEEEEAVVKQLLMDIDSSPSESLAGEHDEEILGEVSQADTASKILHDTTPPSGTEPVYEGVFNKAYNISFVPDEEWDNEITQTGDGSAASELDEGAGSASDAPPKHTPMQHYHQAHNMTFKGAKLDFIGGKMIRRQQTTPVVNSHVGNVQGSNQQQVSNGLYPNASIAPYRGDLQVMQHTTTTSTSYRPRSFLPAPPAPAQQYGRPGFRTGYGQHPKTYTSDACRILTNFGI